MVGSSIAADDGFSCIEWEIDTTKKHLAFYVSKACGCYLVHFLCSPPSTIGSTEWNLCCISKSNMKDKQKSDWKSDLPWFCYNLNYHKCMFVDFLTGYIVLPLESPTTWKHVSFMVFILSSNHTPIKYRCSIKKSNRTTPQNLIHTCTYWTSDVSERQGPPTIWGPTFLSTITLDKPRTSDIWLQCSKRSSNVLKC